jgi:hypothetical protein
VILPFGEPPHWMPLCRVLDCCHRAGFCLFLPHQARLRSSPCIFGLTGPRPTCRRALRYTYTCFTDRRIVLSRYFRSVCCERCRVVCWLLAGLLRRKQYQPPNTGIAN